MTSPDISSTSSATSGAPAVPSGTNPVASTAAATQGVASTQEGQTSFNQINANARNIGTMAALKKNHPKLYKYMMESMARNIIIQLNRQNERVKESMRKLREKNS
jgi:hypothetical protein